jgi:hypothetical protein
MGLIQINIVGAQTAQAALDGPADVVPVEGGSAFAHRGNEPGIGRPQNLVAIKTASRLCERSQRPTISSVRWT